MIFSWIKKNFSSQKAFAKNSLILFCGTMIVGIFNYVFHLVVGRIVSVEVYGEAESLISLIAIISVPAITLNMVATKYVAACKAEDDKRKSLEILSYLNKKVLKYGMPIFLLVIIATPIVGKFLNIQNNFALMLVWFLMLLSFFSSINSGVLSGWQKFKEVSLSSVLGATGKLFFGFILVKIGYGINGIVGSFVLGSVVAYGVSIAILKFIILKKEKDSGVDCCLSAIDFKSIKRYIMPVFIGNLAITILGNADMVLAKHNLDAMGAGQYGALTVVSKIIFFVTGIISSVLFSMSAENSHKGKSSRYILVTALAIVLGASSFATLIYFMYPTFILHILFGDKYRDVASYLGWFAIATTLFSLLNVIFQYLLSIHKTKIAYALFAISIFMIGGIFLFGKTISAILIAIIISQLVAIIAGIYLLQTTEELKFLKNKLKP